VHNQYLKEFNKINNILKVKHSNTKKLKEVLNPVLLKLNNPTFYSKYLYASPYQKYGYPSSSYKNNHFIIFTSECISIINKSQDVDEMLKKLQIELSWLLKIPFNFYLK